MKFVALVALSLALVQAAELQYALLPQTLLQEPAGCDKCACGSVQSRACTAAAKTTCRCAQGFAGTDGNFTVGFGACNACSGSQYQDEEGQGSCKTCGANSIGAALSGTHCYCEAGFIGRGTSSSPCTPCATGRFQDMGGQTACFRCDSCPRGQENAGGCSTTTNTQCQCSAGFAGSEGAFTVGTEGCNSCEADKYQDEPGKGSCKTCPSNSSRRPATVNDGKNCICDRGFFGEGHSTNGCAACADGTYQDEEGQRSCKNCYVCGNGETEASACTTTSDRTCICEAGFSGSQGNCAACQAGKFQNQEGQSSCKNCFSCTGAEEEMSGCSTTAQATCRCAPGNKGYDGTFEATQSGRCSACESGKFQPQPGKASCTACSGCAGNSEVEATPCSAQADTTCKCAPGYSGAPGACRACEGNTYQDEAGQGSCKNCPDNSARVAGDDGTKCSCNAGFTNNGDSCTACSAGTFKSNVGDGACQPCPEGSTSSDGASECVADKGNVKDGDGFSKCPANTYKSDVGNTACEPCGDNSSSDAGSTSANDCVCDQGYEGTAGSCTRIRQFVSGTINNFSLTAKTITFSDISDPVVFVSPLTYNGPDSAVTRVVAGNNQYSVEIEEPDCLDQRHPVEESCDWLVIQKGDLQYGGSTISVFTADVAVDLNGYETVTFPQGGAFGNQPPTCFAYIQSKNNDYYLAPRIKSTSATELRVRIEADERKKKDKASYNSETLGFICFENGVTSLTGDWGNFGIGTTTTSRGNMDQDFSVNVGAGLTKVFSQMTTLSGGNPTIIRHKGLSNGVLTFRLQEDVCRDNDNFHVVETVSAFGFQ